jgi:two-component system, chemotaxis family, sensor kinase CheA
MDQDELIQRLMQTFLGELEEHVQAMNAALLSLERDPPAPERDDLLGTLFRRAHSLKGAARSVEMPLIESLCHRLETVLASLRSGGAPAAAAPFELLFAAADALQDSGERLRQGRPLADSALEAMALRLDAAQRSQAPEAAVPAAPGSRPARQLGTAPQAVPREAAAASGPAASEDGGFVRITAQRLDALLASAGELSIARRRLESRERELAAVQDLVRRWQAEWRRLRRPRRLQQGAASAAAPLRLRELLARTGERLARLERELERFGTSLAAEHRALAQAASPLELQVHRLRMLPFAEGCRGLERAVRDLARARGRGAALSIEGGEVELDRSVLEALRDPLLHLVRNAVDHGIEPPAERLAAGKPAQGTVTVAAALRGSQVEVSVSDDGRGLDLDAIRAELRRRGHAEPDERELARSVFLPGLSTARELTEISGRGMGLDVVRSGLAALHGTADVRFQPGRGSRFVLNVPLTLTRIRVLFVRSAGQVYAIPATNVRRLVRVSPSELRSAEGRTLLAVDGGLVAVVSLADVLGTARAWSETPRLSLAVLSAGERSLALAVDELLTEEEVVVKGLGPRLAGMRSFAGGTILSSGRVGLILSAADLVERALGTASPFVLHERPPAATVKRRILLADDSLTTRTLEKSILMAAGYEVVAAADGAQAWRLLQEHGADLLVSDVEMPEMNGIALVETIRASRRFRNLPVILVTALGSEKDRARGLEAGASAYLVKSAFDQRVLLETIEQLL